MSLPLARFARLASLLVLAPLAACSSSSDPQSAGPGAVVDPASFSAFSNYCVGTLKADTDLMAPVSGTTWMTDGTQAVAGAKFLLAYEFGAWSGYAIRSNGNPAKLASGSTGGLTRDKDFTSDCAIPTAFVDNGETLLAKTTLYPAKDLSGSPCTLEAGTHLADFSIDGSGDVATVSSSVIKSQCGLDKAYAKTFSAGPLMPR